MVALQAAMRARRSFAQVRTQQLSIFNQRLQDAAKLKALFAHLQLSRGAQQLRSREAANGPGSPLAA